MHASALHAYRSVEQATVSGRETEARVLTEASRQLRQCQKLWSDDARAERLEAALRYNQRVWTIFQIELGKADNPLPDPIKLDLLRLSRFVDTRTLETLAAPAPEKLNVLIRINDNIAAGLRA